MTGARFTPGPWVLWIAHGEGPRVMDSRCGEAIVEYRDFPKSASVLAERAANARLIAAAPELYAAVEALLGADIVDPTSGVLDFAAAALRKARGGTPNDGSIPSGGL